MDESTHLHRSWWGWGWEERALDDRECRDLAALIPGLPDTPLPAPAVEDIDLPSPRIEAPASLADRCSTAPADRLGHAYGKAYRDVVRALHGQVDAPPDVVAHPADEADVVAILDWASDAGVAVVPFGGGSSVVGGVECDGAEHRGVVSLDLTRLDRVFEVDRVSRAARIQGGALGPVLEDQLRPMGLTLRHFPQSFEFSTLGGWLPTEVKGSPFVSGLVVQSLENGEKKELPVTGVFVEIGVMPNTVFAKDIVAVDDVGRVKVDPRTQRAYGVDGAVVPGLWAAGDCTDEIYHQNNIAAGDAVTAQHSVETNWRNAAERLSNVIAKLGERGSWHAWEPPARKAARR